MNITKEQFINELRTTNHGQVKGTMWQKKGIGVCFCAEGLLLEMSEEWERNPLAGSGTYRLASNHEVSMAGWVDREYLPDWLEPCMLMNLNDQDKLTFAQIADRLEAA